MMHLEAFCSKVGEIVAAHPEADVPRRIAGLLPDLLRSPDLLRADQKEAPPEGYGRHDVFLCPGDRFSVVAAVWPAGYASPIHDHMTWCTFGVFEGSIVETRFRPETDDPACEEAVPVQRREWRVGDVAHLPVGGGDIHRMYNPGDRPAISIHVYGGNAAKLGPNVVKTYREAAAALA